MTVSSLMPDTRTSHAPEAENVRVGKAMCPYCGVGCLVDVKTVNNRVTEVRGKVDASANRGLLCAKGAMLGPILDLPGRLLQPQFRQDRHQPLQDMTWDDAITQAASRLMDVLERYGPESVAMYGSGQLDTESWYLANKLFKGHIHSNNVDSNSRLCMASAVAAYATTLGSDAPPTCYEDIYDSDCIFVAGSNMADAHPVTFQLIKKHRTTKPDHLLIVADPRFTTTAKAADIYIPVKPGGDIALFHAIARIALDQGAIDQDFIRTHTNNFEEYAAMLCEYSLAELAEEAGVELELINQAAQALIKAKNVLSFYCMGLGQSQAGTAKNQALIDVHLLLGQIGRPGAGPFSLTGQPNAMGGRELGGLAHLLPGYRLIENASFRQEVEEYWQIPVGSIHSKRGLTTVEIFKALEDGRIKAIWIAGTNPLVSMPNLSQARQALKNAELIITQDCFETETTQVADFVFPVAQWVERDCTMTNSERMVTRNAKLAEPPGQAKPDWWVFSQMAQVMGYHGFDHTSIETIWDEFRLLTKNRPCDQSGMTNERLTKQSLQWPCPAEDHPGTQRRYTNRQFATPDGKANFIACRHRRPAEEASAE
ncbi:MAG TPA: molybdopterin-dependent oxidoreductase, partial [Phototrophicaceae bacterium]|nr:molybdopterin-dependent oxidoreductase [Phototrophicaceae bacterium]